MASGSANPIGLVKEWMKPKPFSGKGPKVTAGISAGLPVKGAIEAQLSPSGEAV